VLLTCCIVAEIA